MHNPTDEQFLKAQDIFVRSCAGYVCANFVLGLADRHGDNIMVSDYRLLRHLTDDLNRGGDLVVFW